MSNIPDDKPFIDDRWYRDGDVIASGYAKAQTTIDSWVQRYGLEPAEKAGRTNIRRGSVWNRFHRANNQRRSTPPEAA
jgi:hypothetical protein